MNQTSSSSPTPDENPYEPPQGPPEAVKPRGDDAVQRRKRQTTVILVSIFLVLPAAAFAGFYTCAGVAMANGQYDFVTGGVVGFALFLILSVLVIGGLLRWANK
jgi:hypothetical protein